MNSFEGTVEDHLRRRRDEGRKLLLPFVTAGYPVEDWPRLIEGFANAGADGMEIGIPFSDPVMDGPTVQASSSIALEHGMTPMRALQGVADTDPGIPMFAMTYYNVAYRMGHDRYAAELRRVGISAAILPDLPLDEAGPWAAAADDAGIETIMLAAPTASDERLRAVVERARGFVYGVGLVGITGERAELASSAIEMATRLKAITDKPVAIGIGVSSPEQAKQVSTVADGVVIASAIIRIMLDGGSIEQAIDFVGRVRTALDEG